MDGTAAEGTTKRVPLRSNRNSLTSRNVNKCYYYYYYSSFTRLIKEVRWRWRWTEWMYLYIFIALLWTRIVVFVRFWLSFMLLMILINMWEQKPIQLSGGRHRGRTWFFLTLSITYLLCGYRNSFRFVATESIDRAIVVYEWIGSQHADDKSAADDDGRYVVFTR